MTLRIKNILLLFFIGITNIIICQSSSKNYRLLEVSGLNDTINYNFVENEQLYEENWDKLAQPNFWRTLMLMEEDSALINIGSTRQIIDKIAVSDWKQLTRDEQQQMRDSIKKQYKLPEHSHVYMTSGKKHFYDFKKVIPNIGRGIAVFKENNVDPFYAQTILLIESPNRLQKSPTGAYGSFQLMRQVAIDLGLKVNKYKDERKDFDKSAWAAAKLIKTICIPETNKILDAKGIKYNPNDLWYKLLVLHVYHAGAGNVSRAVNLVNPSKGSKELITSLWQTEIGGFRNASQNYTQLALASLIELNAIIYNNTNMIYYCPI